MIRRRAHGVLGFGAILLALSCSGEGVLGSGPDADHGVSRDAPTTAPDGVGDRPAPPPPDSTAIEKGQAADQLPLDLPKPKPDLQPDSGPPQYPTAGLLASFSFNESTGTTVHDHTGTGHDGTANGSHAWENGKLHLIDNNPTSFGWVSIPRGKLMEKSWTVSIWFEAKNAGNGTAGRVLSGATNIGGVGPEWFFQSGLKVAMRINGNTALWNVPTVGTRSTPAPPGHFALPTDAIKANTCYHYLVLHDEPAKRVRAYQAACSAATMALVFDGTYTNSYAISCSDLRLSHSHHATEFRYFDGKYYQLLFYDRLLTQPEINALHGAGRDSVH